MDNITIPPEALDAAARTIAQDLGEDPATYDTRGFDDDREEYESMARAAIEAALQAWPGMHFAGTAIQRDRIILPMPKETSDE